MCITHSKEIYDKLFIFIFPGHELEVQQIGKTTDESSYMIGRFNTDTDTDVTVQLFGQEIINMRTKTIKG